MSATVYHYDDKALNTLALLFAPGFMHLGSQAWVEALCQEFDLTGKKILDFGAGSGGPACFIAQSYEAMVLGVEFSEFLVQKSQELAAQQQLQGRAEFQLIQDLSWSAHQKFDLILSINAISHYRDKDQLFVEFSRMLRASGTFATMDWFHKSPNYSEATQAFFKYAEGVFYLNTPQEYLQRLEKNKLSYVNFKDNTKTMRTACEALIMALKTEHQGVIVTHYGAQYYEDWLEYWSLLLAAMQSGDLITGHVRGVKI